MFNFGYLGVAASLALAAFGSAMGIGAAAQSAIGAWKKSYQQNKPAPFMLVVYCGFPLSQTLYGFVLILASLLPNIATVDPWFILGAGVFGGIGIGASAYAQGKAAACACDAYAETGKGGANYIIVLGIIETVAIFVMALMLTVVAQAPRVDAAAAVEAVETAAAAVASFLC